MPRPAHCLLVLSLALFPALDTAASPQRVTDPALPRSLPAGGPVQVAWSDPAQFSEIRLSSNPAEAARGTWVTDLATHLAEQARTHLTDGQTLSLTLSDIDRAGDFELWNSPDMRDVRMLRDIYPPRIRLDFTLRDAGGQVVAEGQRVLRDIGYLQGLESTRKNTDSLYYEKKLLDRWLVEEFGRRHHLSAGR